MNIYARIIIQLKYMYGYDGYMHSQLYPEITILLLFYCTDTFTSLVVFIEYLCTCESLM